MSYDPTLNLEPETEARRLAAQRLVDKGRELARASKVDRAAGTFRQALEYDPTLNLEPETEARRLAAPALVDNGRKLARAGEVDKAAGAFRQALEYDPTLNLEPETDARHLAAEVLVNKGRELARRGDIKRAIANFSAAQESDPNLKIDAHSWNSLCWFGSLGGFATEVMKACERAVELEPDSGLIRDSHGLARALTEDYSGAIEDFQRYLEWGRENSAPEDMIRQRQDWIRSLQANQNPFTEEELRLLWDQ